jgi:hypothetical protein
VAHEDLIKTREYEQQLAFIEAFHIAEHDPVVARTLAGLRPEASNSLNRRLFEAVCARCARYVAFHREYPFVTAPAAPLAAGQRFVLRQYANDAPLCVPKDEEARGAIVIGSSGSGKTDLLLQLADEGLRHHEEWVVDVKGDAPVLAVRHPKVCVVDANARVDLFARPPYLSEPEFIAIVLESIARTMYLGQTGKSILHEALTTFFQHGQPTLLELIAILERMPRKGDTYDRLNAIRNATLRLRRLAERYPGLATPGGVPLYELCAKSVLWSFTSYTDVEDLIMTLSVHHLFHHHRHHNIRTLHTVIHVDEALLAFRAENNSRINGNPLSELVGLTREYGIGWRLSVNTLSLLDPAVIANTFVLIALNVNSGSEHQAITRTFALTSDQAEYYAHRLTRGQALVRLGDRWRHVMLCTYDKLAFSKTVSVTAWDDAKRRIERLAAREGDERTGWQPPSQASTATASREQPTRAAFTTPANVTTSSAPVISSGHVSHNTSRATPRIALNKHCTAVINDVSTYPLTLTTPCFGRCNLRLSEGERAKTTLTNVGFIESFKVRTGAGRGKTGSAMRLTPAGWTWLGKKPPKSTKGGDSVDHEFSVQHLSRLIPHSSIESLGVDLVIAYNTQEHERLHRALESLSARTIALNSGDLIALEIETSAPQITAPRNVTKDAGFALTVIATFPKHVPSVQHLASDRVQVIDVLRLMDALRLTEAV